MTRPGGDPHRSPVRTRPDPAQSVLAWGLMLLSSALPQIVYTELTGHRAPLALGLAQAGVLVVALITSHRSPRWRPLEGTVRWLLAMVVGWHLLIGAVTGADAWQNWQQTVPWVVRGTVIQLLLFAPTLLLIVLGPGRAGRTRLRLVAGNDRRRAGPGLYTVGTRPTWRTLGACWAVLITAGTATAMAFAVSPSATQLAGIMWVAPIVMVLAATNTVNEEFGYRNVPLALLPEVIGDRQALLLTGALFVLAHYYGNPPAASGVVLATFLGVLLAKSMLETDGSGWAWAIHWLQDIVIFTALAATWPGT